MGGAGLHLLHLELVFIEQPFISLGEMRLPLCAPSEKTLETLKTLLNSRYGLI